ncbi:MAG TPA: hypothetical protein VGM78_15755 [Ilumatobacteraceae bacterium]
MSANWPGQFGPPGFGGPGQFGQPGFGQPVFGTPGPYGTMPMSTDMPKPPHRRLRAVWLVLFVLTAIGSCIAIAAGIVSLVHASRAVGRDAVARGTLGQTLQFTADKPSDYTIYIVDHTSNSDDRDDLVSDTSCGVILADGTKVTMSGSRQGSSTSIGDTASVGSFHAPVGRVAVLCKAFGAGFPYLVSPGKVAIFAGLLLIFAGVGGILLAILFGILAFRRPRRRPQYLMVGPQFGVGAPPFGVGGFSG